MFCLKFMYDRKALFIYYLFPFNLSKCLFRSFLLLFFCVTVQLF